MENEQLRVLTVSYGEFSLSLEGFEEPFVILHDVTEYFRQLSEIDPKFGLDSHVNSQEVIDQMEISEINADIALEFENYIFKITPKPIEIPTVQSADTEILASAVSDSFDHAELAENLVIIDSETPIQPAVEHSAIELPTIMELVEQTSNDTDTQIQASNSNAPIEGKLILVEALADTDPTASEPDLTEASYLSELEFANGSNETAAPSITEDTAETLILDHAITETDLEAETDTASPFTKPVVETTQETRRTLKIIRNDHTDDYVADDVATATTNQPTPQDANKSPFKRFSNAISSDDQNDTDDVRMMFRKLTADSA